MIDKLVGRQLLEACRRINTPEFIPNDPVQFPRMFSSLPDIEIAALLSAAIAWGRRPQILKDCKRLLEMMDYQPVSFLLSGAFEQIDPAMNVHRTCFGSHIQYYLRGLLPIYKKHGSLQAFVAASGIDKSEAPAWALAQALGNSMRNESGGMNCPQVMPANLQSTALKRINMALRWLVRNDGIVDMGVWDCLKPSQLFIPLDVHVANTSRALGLLERRSNDRRAVELLTGKLREFDPSDPVKFDFALFGLGIENALKPN